MVPATGRALERQREILEWKNPHLERFRRSPQLRRVLATAGDGRILEEGKRPDAHCRGMVGSGGLLRPDQDLRDAGASRPKADQFLRRRAVESRRLGAFGRRPPRNITTDRKLYFRADGKLSFDPPTETDARAFDSFVSDPANPVPYRPRPIEATYYSRGSGWREWLVEDQRFVHRRPDVLSWETDPLTEDVTITGALAAHLFASTSGTDSDWIVKLIDVYPEDYPKDYKMGGYQLMIANDAFRGRFRKSFEKPEPIKPDEVNEYVIDLHQCDHRFLKGHKIMVQVQSTWFPVIDRNPQKYVENIFKAREEDYIRATQRVFRSKQFPSDLTVPVMTK